MFGRVGGDGEETEGTLLQSLVTGSGRTCWMTEGVLLPLRDRRPRADGIVWGRGTLEGEQLRAAPAKTQGERQGAACRSHYALALRLFTTQHLTEGSGRD